jgi:ABC-2 type transport system ATP-binding protein
VAIIAHGQIVAQGPPGDLAGRGDAATRISFRLPAGVASADLPEKLGAAVGDGEVRLEADDPVPVLHELTSWALEHRIPLTGLEVRRPSLEDVYLELTAGEEKAEE